MDEKLYFTSFQPILKYFTPLFHNYVKSIESQRDCLYSMEHFALSKASTFTPGVFVKTLNYLYDEEILAEEVILHWHKNHAPLPSLFINKNQSIDTLSQKKLRDSKLMINFVNWLAEAEEESSEEE